MKIQVLALIIVAFVLQTGCKKVSSQEELQKVRELEESVKANRKEAMGNNSRPDQNMLVKLGESYVAFADAYPEAPETPEFLFRAGELYSNELHDLPKALTLFEKIYKNHPDHETAPNALFFTGYLYNNNLGDLEKAKASYNDFLKKYPSHKMAPHAQFELDNLGIPISEVVKNIIGKDSTAKNTDSSDVHNHENGENQPHSH